jgi:hypothetical protein
LAQANANEGVTVPITRTPIVDDDGSGKTGTVLDNAWKQELYNQIDAATPAAGVWQAVPFNAANFSGATVTAGQVTTNRYMRLGNTLFWILEIDNSNMITAGALGVVVPTGAVVNATVGSPVFVNAAGSWVMGRAGATAGQNYLQVVLATYAGIPVGVLYLQMSIMLEVR